MPFRRGVFKTRVCSESPTYAAKVDYATGGLPYSVTSADVNGDAKLDLIVANEDSDTVSVLINAYGVTSFTEQG